MSLQSEVKQLSFFQLHSENTSEVASSPSIGSPSKSKTSSSVKDLASRFENVLIKPKDISPSVPLIANNESQASPQANSPVSSIPNHSQENIESRTNLHNQIQLNSTREQATKNNEATSTPPLKSALKTRSDYSRDPINDSQPSNARNVVGFADNPNKVIKSALKQTVPHSPTSLQAPNLNGSSRPMQPPDYATAMQRLELIRTSNSDANFQQLEQDLPIPTSETDGPRRKSGSKKTVTFSDEVVLVACAEYDEIDFSSNPLFERVYQQHVGAGKGEISILSSNFGNFQGQEKAVSENSHMPLTCNLCNSKPATSPNNYCTDCEFYLSRFKA